MTLRRATTHRAPARLDSPHQRVLTAVICAALGAVLLVGVGVIFRGTSSSNSSSRPAASTAVQPAPCTPQALSAQLQAARDDVGRATTRGINPGGKLSRDLTQADGALLAALQQTGTPCP